MVNETLQAKMELMAALTRLAEDAWGLATVAHEAGQFAEQDKWLALASAAVREVLRLRAEVRDLSRLAPPGGTS